MAFMDNSVYASTARFDGSARALEESELRNLAPSIFAEDRHEDKTSDRFHHVNTWEVLQGLAKEGFLCVGARQSVVRDTLQRNHTKHLLRLRKFDAGQKHQVGDSVYEIILKNGSDGSAQFELMSGLFRIQCQNSLVTQTSTFNEVRVKHSGKHVKHKVIEGVYTVLKTAEDVMAAPEKWSKITLEQDHRLLLAEKAHELRFEGKTNILTPEMLLRPARKDDEGLDLWKTFNVIQERCLKGKQTYSINGGGRRQFVTKAVKSVDREVKVNQGLWQLASAAAEVLG